MAGISSYSFELSRPTGVYYAGEKIEGKLLLHTAEPITCRAVRVRLLGQAKGHWSRSEGSGDNRHRVMYTARTTHVDRSITAFGSYSATGTLDGAGSSAVFEAESGIGELSLPWSADTAPADFLIAVRVMDYDWGAKDDLLGEVLLSAKTLLEFPGSQLSFPLRPQGEVTVSASLETYAATGTQYLSLHCRQATGLRSGDWMSSNDVYVQAYQVPPATSADQPLPLPAPTAVLPAGVLEVPFALRLPYKMIPSSAEWGFATTTYTYVRYQLYSNIDTKMARDPSTKRVITVLSSEMPQPTSLLPAMRANTAPITIYGVDCCGCIKCCEKGTASLSAVLSQTYLLPGSTFFVAAIAHNNTDTDTHFNVRRVQPHL